MTRLRLKPTLASIGIGLLLAWYCALMMCAAGMGPWDQYVTDVPPRSMEGLCADSL